MYQKKRTEENLCPFEYALSIFKGKWDVRIICLLAHNQVVRYGQFKHLLPEISDTVLATSLKKMVDHRIVEKTVYHELPQRAEYQLTPNGQSVVPVLQALCRWSADHHREDLPLRECEDCKYGITMPL